MLICTSKLFFNFEFYFNFNIQIFSIFLLYLYIHYNFVRSYDINVSLYQTIIAY